jgi:hypothetical protein
MQTIDREHVFFSCVLHRIYMRVFYAYGTSLSCRRNANASTCENPVDFSTCLHICSLVVPRVWFAPAASLPPRIRGSGCRPIKIRSRSETPGFPYAGFSSPPPSVVYESVCVYRRVILIFLATFSQRELARVMRQS